MTDLLDAVAELVDIPSESFGESRIADHVEGRLRAARWLDVHRLGDNVVARTQLGRAVRLVLAGHLDTVPANGNGRARRQGDVLWGLGAADMKAGCAVFLQLACTVAAPAVDVTYVFYAAEEVDARHNGLGHLLRQRPGLVSGDAAILGEPTDAAVEAGCQGTLRVELVLTGERAHTARPWTGRNAIHRLAPVLGRLVAYDGRRVVMDGCEYREALSAVAVEGGVAGNVVPDRARLVVNHRFAPDRTPDEAEVHVRSVIGPLDEGDRCTVVDVAPAAAPALDHPLLRALVDGQRLPVRGKLGWTDVARFAAHGIPAANLGPGDPLLAHRSDERVGRPAVEAVHAALLRLLLDGPCAR